MILHQVCPPPHTPCPCVSRGYNRAHHTQSSRGDHGGHAKNDNDRARGIMEATPKAVEGFMKAKESPKMVEGLSEARGGAHCGRGDP